MMTDYVALLRGINVGGKNKIRMADLAACFEAHGHADVRTYIQSGNVVFRSHEPDRAALTASIEEMLSSTFGYSAVVTLRSHEELSRAVDAAPRGFGMDPGSYLCDVLFLMPPLTPAEVLERLTLREGVDQAGAGTDVVYFQRLRARAAQSRLSRIVSMPMYKLITIRSWSTTVKLLALMDEQTAGR